MSVLSTLHRTQALAPAADSVVVTMLLVTTILSLLRRQRRRLALQDRSGVALGQCCLQ
jgi:hypothetical protein